jgi:DNA-binding NarL/FixJ family response regulator
MGELPVGTYRRSGARRVRVVVAEENAVLRFGMRTLLESSPAIEVVAEVRGGAEAAMLIASLGPDVLLLGVASGDPGGLDILPHLDRSTSVLVLSNADDPDTVARAVSAGARGYLVHGQVEREQIVDAVLGTAAGLSFLSPSAAAALVDRVQGSRTSTDGDLTRREREVMELIAGGLTNQEIAARLVISGKTVKNHVHQVYKRLKVAGREQAVARWRQICPEAAVVVPLRSFAMVNAVNNSALPAKRYRDDRS